MINHMHPTCPAPLNSDPDARAHTDARAHAHAHPRQAVSYSTDGILYPGDATLDSYAERGTGQDQGELSGGPEESGPAWRRNGSWARESAIDQHANDRETDDRQEGWAREQREDKEKFPEVCVCVCVVVYL